MDWDTRRQHAELATRIHLEVSGPKLAALLRELTRRWNPRGWRRNRLHRRGHLPPQAALVRRVSCLARDTRPGVRQSAIRALAHAGAHAGIARPVLVDALQDPDPHTRLAAALSLACVPLPVACAPVLQEALSDPLWTVRWRVAQALARLGQEDVVEQVLIETFPKTGVAPDWEHAVRLLDDLSAPLAVMLRRYTEETNDGKRG